MFFMLVRVVWFLRLKDVFLLFFKLNDRMGLNLFRRDWCWFLGKCLIKIYGNINLRMLNSDLMVNFLMLVFFFLYGFYFRIK